MARSRRPHTASRAPARRRTGRRSARRRIATRAARAGLSVAHAARRSSMRDAHRRRAGAARSRLRPRSSTPATAASRGSVTASRVRATRIREGRAARTVIRRPSDGSPTPPSEAGLHLCTSASGMQARSSISSSRSRRANARGLEARSFQAPLVGVSLDTCARERVDPLYNGRPRSPHRA